MHDTAARLAELLKSTDPAAADLVEVAREAAQRTADGERLSRDLIVGTFKLGKKLVLHDHADQAAFYDAMTAVCVDEPKLQPLAARRADEERELIQITADKLEAQRRDKERLRAEEEAEQEAAEREAELAARLLTTNSKELWDLRKEFKLTGHVMYEREWEIAICRRLVAVDDENPAAFNAWPAPSAGSSATKTPSTQRNDRSNWTRRSPATTEHTPPGSGRSEASEARSVSAKLSAPASPLSRSGPKTSTPSAHSPSSTPDLTSSDRANGCSARRTSWTQTEPRATSWTSPATQPTQKQRASFKRTAKSLQEAAEMRKEEARWDAAAQRHRNRTGD